MKTQERTPAERRADAIRQRRSRANRKNRERSQRETIFRRLLENFYAEHNLRAADWVLGAEFVEATSGLVTLKEFQTAMALDAGIETGRLRNADDSVLIIRPKYFLTEQT